VRIFLGVTPAALRAALTAGSAGSAGSVGYLGTAPVTAFAVTEALRASVEGGGAGEEGEVDRVEADEELTLLAVEAAAWQSLQGLAADAPAAGTAGSGADRGGADARRVVLAVDVPDAAVTALAAPDPLAAGGGVRIAAAVALDAVVSVLADGAGLAASVAAAVAAVAAGRTVDDLEDLDDLDDLDDLGDGTPAADPALAALDEVLATPLLWYDAVELPQLLDGPRQADRSERTGASERLPAAPADTPTPPRSLI